MASNPGSPEPLESPNSFAIRCTNVPSDFFTDRALARKYFRRFGKIKAMGYKAKLRTCVIEYYTEESLLNALEIAGEYNGTFFNVVRHDTVKAARKKKVKKDQDPDWTNNPEIQAELAAMEGQFLPKRSYNLRPEGMIVDVVTSPKVSKLKRERVWKSPKTTKKRQSEETSIFTPETSELAALMTQQAQTVEDKYRILDARDKLLRINLRDNLELKLGATIGTCPDMCPEKERLMREVQHQVALYEQETNGKGMNPKLAVKQYSRSSADQEAPLPQELRPVGTLQMTMGYLMHRILNLCDSPDVNIAEWYHFLWDRTRGIRKDITQQELCCQGSVELVEQCARFHIFCSARFVAEDPAVFDQKINTENLTKCLQTLKYMYHDLQLKGESCRNEPEFRAYIILLNLNDGNFMWEVQQLKRDIQQSTPIRFALAVYSSLDKNNYVKFFKLVNSTTFLNACILMRYFVQVRLSAINTFLKCYAPRASLASIPLTDLYDILAFESIEATIDFLECHGLYTNTERSHVILDKKSFSLPEYPYVLDRAIRLVEAKRASSIGQVVCGRELPEKTFENHVPQNSFYDDGYLRPMLELGGQISCLDTTTEVPIIEEKIEPLVEESVVEVDGKKDFDLIEERNFEFEGAKILDPVAPPPVKPIWGVQPSNIFVSSEKLARPLPSNVVVNNFVWNEVPRSGPDLAQLRAEAEAKKRDEEEKREKIRKELKEKQRQLELDKQVLLEKKRRIEEIKLAELAKLKRKAEEEKRKEVERLKLLEIERSVSFVVGNLLDEVEEMVKSSKLVEIRRRIEARTIRKIVAKWQENSRRKRKRKATDFTPVLLGPKTIEEQAAEFQTESQNLTLKDMKRYKSGRASTVDIIRNSVEKIQIFQLTYKVLSKRISGLDEIFWKISVSLPDNLQGLHHIETILSQHLQLNANTVVDQFKPISGPALTYCIEKTKGSVSVNKSDSHGFVFIADDLTEELWQRISVNLRNFGVFVKVPVVLILKSYTENKAKLKLLTKERIVSDYVILIDDFTAANLVNVIDEAFVFLASRIEEPPPLLMDRLSVFLDKHLSDVWKRAASFSKWNSNYRDCLKNPNTVIYLHNEALGRLKKILFDETCSEHFKFPEVFKRFLNPNPDLPCDYKYFPNFWTKSVYVKHVEEIVDDLTLPKLVCDWPPRNQQDLEAAIYNYCQIFKTPDRIFYKIMSVLLKNFDPASSFGEIKNVVWIEIIELLSTEKLQEADFSFYGTGFVNKSTYKELMVVYDKKKLSEFSNSDWFYINNPVIKCKVLDLLKIEEEVEEDNEIEEFELDFDIDASLEMLMRRPQSKRFDQLKDVLQECRSLMGDLEESFSIHKKIQEKSGSLLKSIIGEN